MRESNIFFRFQLFLLLSQFFATYNFFYRNAIYCTNTWKVTRLIYKIYKLLFFYIINYIIQYNIQNITLNNYKIQLVQIITKVLIIHDCNYGR